MKIKNNQEKSKPTDAKREFYSCLDEMKDLYLNQGYLKQKSLYEKMKEKYKWQMSYQCFSNYFNKEIKNKTPKEKPLIDNNYQINQTKEKDIKDEKQQISTTNERVISDEARQRFERRRALMQPTIEALTQCAKELYQKQQEEEEK